MASLRPLSLFSIHNNCSDPDCIDLGIASPPESPIPEITEDLRELFSNETLGGYGDPQGLASLRLAISRLYSNTGVDVSSEHIVVTDGAHEELVLWGREFASGSSLIVQVPHYPAILAGHSGNPAPVRLRFHPEEHLQLKMPDLPFDYLYLCSPHNPMGEQLNRPTIEHLISRTLANNATIIWDNVYNSFASALPFRTVYSIDGAPQCVVEVNSLSKSANFAGIRAGWVAMHPGQARSEIRDRRIELAFTQGAGVGKVSQTLAETAISTPNYERAVQRSRSYLESAAIIKHAFEALGLRCIGADAIPLVWVQVPAAMTSIEFWSFLHTTARINCSPGPIFGLEGEGFVRVSGFCQTSVARTVAGRTAALTLP